MSLALDTILSDIEATIEVTVEIDSAKRSDGTLKTWYFSTHPRSTGGSETPANTEFLPFVAGIGPLTQSLSEDLMFNGLAQNSPGTLTLSQSVVDNDELSALNDYVFAGYRIRIKMGRSTDAYASFVTFRTVSVDIDPIVQLTPNGLQATFQLASVLKRLLEEPLIVRHHLGIPHCLKFHTTLTGLATVTKQSVHDATSFTVGIRFRAPTIPSVGTGRRIWTKCSTVSIASNSHWFLRAETTGKLLLQTSSLVSGVHTADVNYTSPTNLCDNNWHSVIYSRDNDKTAYLIIDGGEEVSFTPIGQTDAVNFNPVFGQGSANEIHLCDARHLDRYMTPDEARAYFSTRSNGDDLNVIGLWRFDDNAGASVNDYSSTNADAAITGVVNTDYSWKETDLGEPEIAGIVFPINQGNVLNAKAQLIDSNRERFRGNDGASGWYSSGSNSVLTVRSQGTVLTGGGTDYTAPSNGGDGVFSMTVEEAEPVTYDILNDGTSEENIYPSAIAETVLVNRSRLITTDISNVSPMQILAPWPSGYYTDQDGATVQQALQEILGESGLHYYEEPLGSLYIDMLLPPTGYGPYGEPVLDFRGQTDAGMRFGDIADVSGSCTIAGWVKTSLVDQTAYNFGSSEPNVGTAYLAAKPSTSGNYAVYFQSIGSSAGKLAFRIAGTTLKTPSGIFKPNVWNFFACTFDDSGNTMKIYAAAYGTTLTEITSVANSSSPTTNSSSLTIGGNGYPWVAIQHVHIWNSAKSLSQLQALMTTPPIGNEAGLLAYIPANEGAGSPVEVVSQTTADVFTSLGVPSWCPKFVVNLDETPSIKLTDFHHTHPAWNIIVKYAKNRFPMQDSDIDSGVSQNNKLALRREGLDVRWESTPIRDRFKSAKKVVLDSPITDQESAQRLLRMLINRFSTDNYVGQLTFPNVPGLSLSRIACGLQIGEEIGLVGSYPSQIQTAKSFRVVAVSPSPLKLETTVSIFG